MDAVHWEWAQPGPKTGACGSLPLRLPRGVHGPRHPSPEATRPRRAQALAARALMSLARRGFDGAGQRSFDRDLL